MVSINPYSQYESLWLTVTLKDVACTGSVRPAVTAPATTIREEA